MAFPVYGDLKNGQFGADLTGADLAGVQRALLPDALSGTVMGVLNPAPATASRVVLTNLPTVATQGIPGSVGDPGSCEAQSFGYCLGSYTVARNPNGSIKWSAANPANQPSAAWLYQWAHKVFKGGKYCPSGSGAACYAIKLVTSGAPSTAQYPYNPSGATTVKAMCSYIESINPLEEGATASRFLIGSYKAFTGLMHRQAQYLGTFKSLLRHGFAIAFTGLVANDYCVESPPLVNGAFTAPKGFITGSGHGQAIVGYDDSIGPHGAFLVQNSFGPGWNPGPANDVGSNGRIWWGYGAFFAGQQYAIVMYPNLGAPPAGPRLRGSGSSGGAVDIFVRSARRYSEGGDHYAVFVLHAPEAITLSSIQIAGKQGRIGGTLSETMRFGYAYLQRASAFAPGRYEATISATTQSGQKISFRGPIDIE